MHRLGWTMGSCLTVAFGSALPTILCVLWLSTLPKNNTGGMEALLCAYTAAFGTGVGFLVSLMLVLIAAGRSSKRTGRPTVGAALFGGFLPVVLVLVSVVIGGAISDFRDKTERAEAELASLLTDVAPELPTSTPGRVDIWNLSGAATDCDHGSRWFDSRSIELGEEAPEKISYLHQQLTQDGWSVDFTRAVDPLDTYEIWVVAATKEDLYIDARTELRPGSATMQMVLMVGPCVAERGEAMVSSAIEPGVQVEASFAKPSYSGVARTDLDWALWAPNVLDHQQHSPHDCSQGNWLVQSDRQRIWSANEQDDHLMYVSDPHGSGVRWLADMQAALEADGWETVYKSQRKPGNLKDTERRMLWARNGEHQVQLSARLELAVDGGQADPFAVIETRLYSGPCVADLGLDPSLIEPGLSPVVDPYDFEPIVRKDQ